MDLNHLNLEYRDTPNSIRYTLSHGWVHSITVKSHGWVDSIRRPKGQSHGPPAHCLSYPEVPKVPSVYAGNDAVGWASTNGNARQERSAEQQCYIVLMRLYSESVGY